MAYVRPRKPISPGLRSECCLRRRDCAVVCRLLAKCEPLAIDCERLTGVKASSNILRPSFVSMLMGDNPSEALKQSAAKLLNHGMWMQSEVYDRRDPAQVGFTFVSTLFSYLIVFRKRIVPNCSLLIVFQPSVNESLRSLGICVVPNQHLLIVQVE